MMKYRIEFKNNDRWEPKPDVWFDSYDDAAYIFGISLFASKFGDWRLIEMDDDGIVRIVGESSVSKKRKWFMVTVFVAITIGSCVYLWLR